MSRFNSPFLKAEHLRFDSNYWIHPFNHKKPGIKSIMKFVKERNFF